MLAAHLLLFGSTLAGVLLGLTQERYGNCWLEMSIGSSLICALSVQWSAELFSINVLAEAFHYAVLLFLVHRVVRAHASSVRNDAFLLSLALNERRAITIALGAFQSDMPYRLLLGSVIALLGVQLTTFI